MARKFKIFYTDCQIPIQYQHILNFFTDIFDGKDHWKKPHENSNFVKKNPSYDLIIQPLTRLYPLAAKHSAFFIR